MTSPDSAYPSHHHSKPLETLIPHLVPHLPYSLPLLRRLQFRASSSSAHVFSTLALHTAVTPQQPFAATYVDRSRAPETECWIFSTFEQPSSNEDPAVARARLLSLLIAVADLDDNDAEESMKVRNPLMMVMGTLNEKLLPLLAGNDMEWMRPKKILTRNLDAASSPPSSRNEEKQGVLSGISVPYFKWLIQPPSPVDSPKESRELPKGYEYSKPHVSELGIVLSRSEIPRTAETLGKLGSVGIRFVDSAAGGAGRPVKELRDLDDGTLVAWAFLGVDGSLTALHVEMAHRGKGLGKACSGRLFSLLAGNSHVMGFPSSGGGAGWAHSDVAEDNKESAGVARALGGKLGWKVRWVGVDMRRVKQT